MVVKTFRASHPPVHPAVGYRIEYKNKVIFISGDSTPISPLRKNSQDANLLVCEVMNKEIVHMMEKTNKEIGNARAEKLLFDIHDYHMDITDVATLAKEANVERLALNDLAPKPRPKGQANRLFRNPIESVYSGDLFVGEDGMKIMIPLQPN